MDDNRFSVENITTPQTVPGIVTLAFDFAATEIINPIRARNWNFALVQLVNGATINELGYADPTTPLIFGDPLETASPPTVSATLSANPTNLVVSETAADTFSFETGGTSLNSAGDLVILRFAGGEWDIAGATLGTGTTLGAGGSLSILTRTDSTLSLEADALIAVGVQVLHITGIVSPSTADGDHWIGVRTEDGAGAIIEGETRVFMTVYDAPAITFSTPASADTASTTDGGADFTLAYTLTDPLGDLGATAQVFELFVSMESALNIAVQGGGAARAFDPTPVAYDATVGAGVPGNEIGGTLNTSNLPEGTWYVYAVMAGTGDVSRGRSGAIIVTHPPFVNSVDPVSTITLDSGDAAFQDDDVIDFDIEDFDDNADVRLFYSTNGALDTSSVTTSGTSPSITITGLTGATLVVGSDSLTEDNDNNILWSIITDDTTFVAKGTYTVYAVATDGKNIGFGSSASTYTVQHSPTITLSAPTTGTFDTGTSQVLMIAWHGSNGDGDKDIDDDATIDLYWLLDANASGGGPYADGKVAATLAAFDVDVAAGDAVLVRDLRQSRRLENREPLKAVENLAPPEGGNQSNRFS